MGGGSQYEWFMYFNDSFFLTTLQRRKKETKITTSREWEVEGDRDRRQGR
jgi:hypothetical protein